MSNEFCEQFSFIHLATREYLLNLRLIFLLGVARGICNDNIVL